MSSFLLPDAMVIGLYWVLAVLCCGYAALAGGRSGRIGAAMIITASVASAVGGQFGTWAETHVPVLAIDLILLAGFYWLALKSESYWPLWATGFHLLSVISHVAIYFIESVRQIVYFSFGAFWSLPVLIVMTIGIARDRAARLRQG